MLEDNPIARLKDDPWTDTVHHPYSAFNQGFDAYIKGFKRDDNPYPSGQTRRWWEWGFSESSK